MNQPTHFIEQYSRKPEYAKLLGRDDTFTSATPIKYLHKTLAFTDSLEYYHTVAVFFITPKNLKS